MRFYNRNELQLLKKRIEGDVHDEPQERYLLSTDASMYRKMPACVVYPKNSRDVREVVCFGNENDFTVHARGAGSGLCGSSLGNGIILDFTRYMNRLIHFDPKRGTVECEPGYRMGELLRDIEPYGFFFPPDPSSGEYATMGGMLATNASGSHSVKYGSTGDYLIDADIVLGGGRMITLSEVTLTPPDALPTELKSLFDLYVKHSAEIESAYPRVRFNNCGYNLRGLVVDGRLDLRRLFAGAEGTLGIATRLKFQMKRVPTHRRLIVAFFYSVRSSLEMVQRLLELSPSGIEMLDRSLLRLARENDPKFERMIPGGTESVILIEFDGRLMMECEEAEKKTTELLSTHDGVISHYLANKGDEERLWAVRKAAVPILYRLKGRKKAVALVEDAVIPTDRLSDYFDRIYHLFNHLNIDFIIYGHVAKGLMHTRPLLDLKAREDLEMLKKISDAMFDIVSSLGGTISGEHGDGRLRSAYVKSQYPTIYDHLLYVKHSLDPEKVLNPEIKVSQDPHLIGRNTRFGFSYDNSKVSAKNLLWPEGFASQIETCHGCSKCTTVTTQTRMCPIYKFTRKEIASPKAKANILRALISGVIDEKEVASRVFSEIMSLCVGCGSCAVECPSYVNIPKMAIEAKSWIVKKKGMRLEDYLTGNVERTLRYTRKLAPLIGRLVKTSFFCRGASFLSGVEVSASSIPKTPFSLFDRSMTQDEKGKKSVLYFAGCYAGYLRPEIGTAAVRVLRKLGMNVMIPLQYCCGLPLYSKGALDSARGKIGLNLRAFGDSIQKVDHIVVTCSSCGYALMEGWPDLVDHPSIRVLKSKLLHISELIQGVIGRTGLKGEGEAMAYHMPCHLKVQKNPNSSIELLHTIEGSTVKNLDSHCCGMAGSWGMILQNASLSRTIGADLIGKLESSGAHIAVTDCPTCRMQMERLSHIRVYHPVEVVYRAMVSGQSIR